MSTLIDAMLAVMVFTLLFLCLSASAITCILIRSKSECKECWFYLPTIDRCLYDPTANYEVELPRPCKKEDEDMRERDWL